MFHVCLRIDLSQNNMHLVHELIYLYAPNCVFLRSNENDSMNAYQCILSCIYLCVHSFIFIYLFICLFVFLFVCLHDCFTIQ
jgi:uncharacterized protein YqhQ